MLRSGAMLARDGISVYVIPLLVVIVGNWSPSIPVHAQPCSVYTSCSSCISWDGCGWCRSGGRCVPGSSSGPSYGSGIDGCSCSSYTWDSCQNYSQCSANARNWVTAVWATILVVVAIFAICWYFRHRRRQLYYQQQAALNQNQPTIMSSQAIYAAAPGTVGAPVMATMAQPVMAQAVYPSYGQPVPQYVPQQTGEGQPQPMYAAAPYGQPQGYAPVYSPAPGYAYAPVAEGQPVQQPVVVDANAPSPSRAVASGQPYVPVYGAPPAQAPTPASDIPQETS